MSAPDSGGGRLRAYWQFLWAVIYFFVARSFARHAASALTGDQWFPLVEQAFLVFLLLLGYAALGFWLNRQMHPVSAQGLPRRPGWAKEAGLGLATGWGIALICVLLLALVGGIAISVSTQASSWGWLAADAAFFALAALAEEIAFRGYGFQRFVHAVGPLGASLGFAAYYAIVQAIVPGSNHASVFVSVVLGLVLSAAYLRTRALWLSWGLNFGWKASRALLFGLAVSGVNSHSPVVQGNPMGPFWLTGGGFGLEGSWVTSLILLAALPVVFRITRDLDFLYNAPVIVPGGIPVDLDAAARAQHESAMGPAEPAAPTLVQIGQIGPVATTPPLETTPPPDRPGK
ncbi:MAG TPA: CPBP family glutamic-type intramembrane protease [Terracidiphilus sp.]|nr:CPBP family glutamic-type intramembrane protease [Terracidiphilus sp.]